MQCVIELKLLLSHFDQSDNIIIIVCQHYLIIIIRCQCLYLKCIRTRFAFALGLFIIKLLLIKIKISKWSLNPQINSQLKAPVNTIFQKMCIEKNIIDEHQIIVKTTQALSVFIPFYVYINMCNNVHLTCLTL